MINVNKTEYFTNRELSWLDFDNRVLSEARDKNIPLFERIKFVSITSSNLDEFFMIRVASLKDMVNAGYTKADFAGLTPQMQLDEISVKAHELVNLQYSTYNRSIKPALKQNGLIIVDSFEELNEAQTAYVNEFFEKDVYPVLTPMAVDSSRPFPLIRNKTLNIGALVAAPDAAEDTTDYDFATVQVPSVLPRFIEIPSADQGTKTLILLEQVIEMNIQKLFMNHKVVCAYPYRIMRNADFDLDEDEAADLLKEIEEKLKRRQWGEVIRMEIEDGMDKRLLKKLKKSMKVDSSNIYKISGPLDLTYLMKVNGLDGFDHLKYPKYTPVTPRDIDPERGLFEQIRERDILLAHPFESFDPVVNLVKEAADDPDVLAIKQTLYRVSGNSPIIKSLARAAENGKQVSVLVELKARFDEENNIAWAKELEQAGCHVIYGLRGLKTHCKIILVVRREEDGIRRYVHLGTGNYNDSTAKLYTDMGLMTCQEPIGEDATAVFNMLSGYSEPLHWNKLALAPIWLRDKFTELIRQEARNAAEGNPAHIVAKMNSLCDPQIMKELYLASAAGVKIELIVRGICCLKTGIPGISENITVKSIVGNFLEHSRVFYFYNNGWENVFMGSADWMPRNLDKRVEILFPVEDEACKARVMQMLDIQLADNVKGHYLQADNTYVKPDKRGKVIVSSQDEFCRMAVEAAKERKKGEGEQIRIFEPMYNNVE